jgi:predicted ATP-dependent endonuclease of OLD family
MEFRKGLNVVIGANNSGKTGLLYAIRILSDGALLCADDFNKNNLLKYAELYLEDAPSVEMEYVVRHLISESDAEDESIIRLLPFLGMEKLNETKIEDSGDYQYDITAVINAVWSLDSKAVGEYRSEVEKAINFSEYMTVLKSFVPRYSWTYRKGASNTEADKKDAIGIFGIRFIGAERTSDAVSKETRREIDVFAKDQSNAIAIAKLRDEYRLK